jgi:hypothetical protein
MILQPKEYNDYLEVHHKLMYYTGKKHNILPTGTSLKDFAEFPLENKFECREYFNEYPDLLEEFIKENQGKLSSLQMKILNGFRSRIMSDYFIILKCLKKHAIFIDSENKKVYGVKGLSNPLNDFFDDFPVIVRATLLPFNGKIIYDGFLQSYETYLGPNMTWEYNEIYKEAKNNGQIITSMDPPEIK